VERENERNNINEIPPLQKPRGDNYVISGTDVEA